MNTTQERTIDKVLKLLAKAESTTEEEAEALTAKAHHLMVQAEIDEAMLASAQGNTTDEIIEKSFTLTGSYNIAQQELCFAVGRANGFRLIQRGGGTRRVATWVGWKSDIERAEVIFTSLLIQQTRAAAEFMKGEDTRYMTAFEKHVHKRSHMIGFARGAGSKIRERRDADVKQADEDRAAASPDDVIGDPGTSVALVLRTKEEQVKDWYDEKYGHLRAGRVTPMRGSGSASSAGRDAGRRADVGNPRVGGARGQLGR